MEVLGCAVCDGVGHRLAVTLRFSSSCEVKGGGRAVGNGWRGEQGGRGVQVFCCFSCKSVHPHLAAIYPSPSSSVSCRRTFLFFSLASFSVVFWLAGSRSLPFSPFCVRFVFSFGALAQPLRSPLALFLDFFSCLPLSSLNHLLGLLSFLLRFRSPPLFLSFAFSLSSARCVSARLLPR